MNYKLHALENLSFEDNALRFTIDTVPFKIQDLMYLKINKISNGHEISWKVGAQEENSRETLAVDAKSFNEILKILSKIKLEITISFHKGTLLSTERNAEYFDCFFEFQEFIIKHYKEFRDSNVQHEPTPLLTYKSVSSWEDAYEDAVRTIQASLGDPELEVKIENLKYFY